MQNQVWKKVRKMVGYGGVRLGTGAAVVVARLWGGSLYRLRLWSILYKVTHGKHHE